MKKMVTVDYDEYIKYSTTIDDLRKHVEELNKFSISLQNEIKFLKDSGENILVIVKSTDKPDVHEYKSDEKNVILDLVTENQKVRERYDELSRKNDNLENQKAMILLKYQEMDNFYKNQIDKLNDRINSIEQRGILDRIVNKKIEKIEIQKPSPLLLEPKKEEIIKEVKKPRGWNLQPEFIDDEGNVYHRGVLQPQLKKSKNDD